MRRDPDDECAAIERHLRELDRLRADLGVLDTQIAQAGSDDPAVGRLLTLGQNQSLSSVIGSSRALQV
jgi:hypothetical protein